MVKRISIETPLTKADVEKLKAGDNVAISGTIYTGRDAAHQRIVTALMNGEAPPFELEGQLIYYVGPAPAKPGQVIGSAGPTTSYRMDDLTLPLLERGLRGMIGKGKRARHVIEGMVEHGAVYFAAIGGAGALIANSVQASEVIAYDDLGTEAVRKLTVKDFPAVVVIDSTGQNLYERETAKYREE